MPSKKKAKGKGRGATKSRKELRNDCAASVKNDVESQMQGLNVNNSKQDNEDEDALLEAAINLAAAEREELDATDVEKCDHGFVPLPDMNGFVSPRPLEESWCEKFTDSLNLWLPVKVASAIAFSLLLKPRILFISACGMIPM